MVQLGSRGIPHLGREILSFSESIGIDPAALVYGTTNLSVYQFFFYYLLLVL